jgi:hypothetical protein
VGIETFLDIVVALELSDVEKQQMPEWRVGAVRTDYAGWRGIGTKKRNQ